MGTRPDRKVKVRARPRPRGTTLLLPLRLLQGGIPLLVLSRAGILNSEASKASSSRSNSSKVSNNKDNLKTRGTLTLPGSPAKEDNKLLPLAPPTRVTIPTRTLIPMPTLSSKGNPDLDP